MSSFCEYQRNHCKKVYCTLTFLPYIESSEKSDKKNILLKQKLFEFRHFVFCTSFIKLITLSLEQINKRTKKDYKIIARVEQWYVCQYFWPRGFADAVLGTAYLLLLLFLFLLFLRIHAQSKPPLRCKLKNLNFDRFLMIK